MQGHRDLREVITSVPASDGAGVRLRRSLGGPTGQRVDPFLMLDEFFSDDPNDYLAGFPSHPHRGFETVTYMLDGRMRHEDSCGNRGDLGPGDVQWMTAARGIIHSEMPQQTAGRMRGFQLWLNLPASAKMQPAAYRDIPASDIPEYSLSAGCQMRLIAGALSIEGKVLRGATLGQPSTAPLFADLRLLPGATIELPIARELSAFVYPYDGAVELLGSDGAPRSLPLQGAAVLDDGDRLALRASHGAARLLLLAGRALNEPVVQYGPFVMNTRAEIEQAVDDYRNGRLVEPARSSSG
ncbi:MAG: pirin family protein [Steroidobacteraceae bacterium]